jgi:hypothetical protein
VADKRGTVLIHSATQKRRWQREKEIALKRESGYLKPTGTDTEQSNPSTEDADIKDQSP